MRKLVKARRRASSSWAALLGAATAARALTTTTSSYPPFVYHEAYSCPWPPNHRFPMAKFHVLKETLVNSGAFRGNFVTPTHPLNDSDGGAGMAHVYAVHDRDYVDRFVANVLTHEEKRRIGLDFNEHLVHRTLAEVGGTVTHTHAPPGGPLPHPRPSPWASHSPTPLLSASCTRWAAP